MRRELSTLRSLALLWFLFTLGACSSTKQLHYYSLQPSNSSVEGLEKSSVSTLGVGPIKLPESQIGDGVLTRDDQFKVELSDEHLWAGDLKLGISRTISSRLSNLLNSDYIIAYPWDTRQKPSVQLFIQFEQFSGPLNGELTLAAKWSEYDLRDRKIISTHRSVFVAPKRNRGYGDYVADLNNLLDQFTIEIARQLSDS